MDYYAATLREPGTKLNNDGLMVKGIHLKDGTDLLVMAISSCGMNKKLCHRVIKDAEKVVYKRYEKDVEYSLEKLFQRVCKKGLFFKKRIPDITMVVLRGIEYSIMTRGNNRVMMAKRLGSQDLHEKSIWKEHQGYISAEGRLSEGTTIIVGNPSFFERQLESEIHKRLCPQMCTDENEMQINIEYLWKQLWSRGEERPVTAVALCVK